MKINVEIKMTKGMPMPEYATKGAAAMDLRAAIGEDETITIKPNERALIPTGVHLGIENNDIVAIIAARSGLAIKNGVSLSNGIGVIDSDYRGEICVGLINLGQDNFTINRGDRVAQLMFMPVLSANLIEQTELSNTERGTGGFGSTGIK